MEVQHCKNVKVKKIPQITKNIPLQKIHMVAENALYLPLKLLMTKIVLC